MPSHDVEAFLRNYYRHSGPWDVAPSDDAHIDPVAQVLGEVLGAVAAALQRDDPELWRKVRAIQAMPWRQRTALAERVRKRGKP